MTELNWDSLIEESRVHRSVYTDPAIYNLEMEKVFGGVWTYLCHESEIAEPDSFKTVKLGQRPVIVTRDKDNHIHALLNRCSHRGAKICRERSGSTKRFMCPYHGWTFSNSGKLIGASFPKMYEGKLDKDAHALARIPRVSVYRGFIFGTLNEAMPSLEEYLGPAAEYIDHWVDRAPDGELIVDAGAYRGLYHGNWKLTWDNAADGYHVTFAHRSLVEMTAARTERGKGAAYMAKDPDDSEMYCKRFPFGHTLLHHRPGMGPSMWTQARPMPGKEAYTRQLESKLGEEKTAEALELAPGYGVNLNIFPNLLLLANQIQVIEPIAPDKTALIWYATRLKGAPEEVDVLRMRIAEDFPNFGEVDDLEMFELCWQGIKNSEEEWINTSRGQGLGSAEDGVHRVTVTNEEPLRGFLQAYKAHMKSEVSCVLS